ESPGSGGVTLADVAPGRHVVTVEAEGFLTERAVVVVEPGRAAEVVVRLAPMSPRLDELTVTASRYDLVREIAPSTAYFSRAEIESLSDFNNDVLRVAQRLPGTAALEFSSRSHIRGGAEDEMTVLFDGVELVAPFHLEDYQSVFSAIDDRIVAGIEVYSGGFPAAYGGALSGLMLVEPRTPTARLAHELGLSLLYTSVLSSGTFADGRGAWVGSIRRGNADVLLKDEEGDPAYRDAYAHLAFELGARHRLGVNGLSLDDDIR